MDPEGGANVTLSTESHKYPVSVLRCIKYLKHDINDTLSTVSLMIHSRAVEKIFTSSTSVLQFCLISFNSAIKGNRARFMTDIQGSVLCQLDCVSP